MAWKSGRATEQEARGDRVKFKIVRAQKFGVLLLYLRVFGVLGRVMLSFFWREICSEQC